MMKLGGRKQKVMHEVSIDLYPTWVWSSHITLRGHKRVLKWVWHCIGLRIYSKNIGQPEISIIQLLGAG